MEKQKERATKYKTALQDHQAVTQQEDRELITIHLKCQDGYVRDTFQEDADKLNESIQCFSDESTRTRCHHVVMRGRRLSIKNVRWPSERKFKIAYIIGIHSNEIISYFRSLRRTHPHSSHITFKT